MDNLIENKSVPVLLKKVVQLLLSILLLFVPVALSAEVISISATGEYVLGDNDTITEGKKLALQDAKRLALEKVGTYLESTTEVKNGAVTVDEIRMYTAGIVKIEEIGEERSLLESKATVIKVNVRVSVDPDVLLKQIVSLRNRKEIENNARKLNSDNVRLRNEIDQLNQQLRSVVDEKKYRQLREQREQVIQKIQENEKGLTLLVSGESLFQAALYDKQKKQDNKVIIRQFIKEMAAAYQISARPPDIEDNGNGTATIRIDGRIHLPSTTYPKELFYERYKPGADFWSNRREIIKIDVKSFEEFLSTGLYFDDYYEDGLARFTCPRGNRRCQEAKEYLEYELKKLKLVGKIGKYVAEYSDPPYVQDYSDKRYDGKYVTWPVAIYTNKSFWLRFYRIPLDELKEVSKIELKIVYQDDEIEPVKETKGKPTVKKAKKKRNK